MRFAEFACIIAADHPAFAGHFPGQPIVPGVVLLDQALLFAETLLDKPTTAWQIGQAKFFNPVGPGQALEYRFQDTAGAAIAFTIRAGGREVAAGSFKPVP